jgi:hypothetical protein
MERGRTATDRLAESGTVDVGEIRSSGPEDGPS